MREEIRENNLADERRKVPARVRLDLARGHGDGAGVLLEGHVGAIDTDDHLLHLRFAGGELLCVHGPDAPPRGWP